MSLVPMGGFKVAPNPTLVERYPDVYLTTGLVAENHAREAGISRETQDAFALRSHQRALAAIDAGRFNEEIVPLTVAFARPTEGAEAPAVGHVDVPRGRRTAQGHVAGSARQVAPRVPCRRLRHGRQLVADERRRRGGADHE